MDDHRGRIGNSNSNVQTPPLGNSDPLVVESQKRHLRRTFEHLPRPASPHSTMSVVGVKRSQVEVAGVRDCRQRRRRCRRLRGRRRRRLPAGDTDVLRPSRCPIPVLGPHRKDIDRAVRQSGHHRAGLPECNLDVSTPATRPSYPSLSTPTPYDWVLRVSFQSSSTAPGLITMAVGLSGAGGGTGTVSGAPATNLTPENSFSKSVSPA